MKTGENIRMVNPEAVDEGVDVLTIKKEGKGSYLVVLGTRAKLVECSAEVRKIIRIAVQNGYKMEKGVTLDA